MPAITLAQRRKLIEEAQSRQRLGRRLLDAATRVTNVSSSGFILAGVSILAWVFGFWIGGRTLYLVAYGAFGVLAVAWFVGRRQPDLTGHRSDLRPRVQEGDQMEVTVALRSARRLSNLVLEERVPSLLGENAQLSIAEVEPGVDVEHTYPLTCWRRGAYRLGPLVARWGDPFGLTEREMELAASFELLVHPRVELAEDHPLTRLWEDPPFRPPTSRPWPHGLEFYGMRPYAPGDDLRKIVWRAFARTGQLLVRESEQGVTDKIVIVLDQDAEYHSKGIVSDSFEAACRVAGSLGVRHLKEGYSVTLEGTSGRLSDAVRSGSGRIRYLDVLARADIAPGSLSELFGRILSTVPRDADLVVVTPLLDREAAARLRLFVDRGMSVLVVALMWLDEAVDSLASAAALGVKIVEVGPNTNLTVAFRHQVASGDQQVTLVEERITADLEDEPAPVDAVAETVAPVPDLRPDTADSEDASAGRPLAELWRPVLAAALASSAAGLVCGGIFGSWAARLTGVVGAFAGAGYVLAAQRSPRRNLLAQLFPPLAVVVAAFSLVVQGASPTDLPALARDAVESGRLFSPPIPYDPGWTAILLLITATIGFASAWVGTELKRARLAVAIPLPLAGLAALTQPDDGEVIAGLGLFIPVLAALTVLFRGDASRSAELGSAFELKRAVRSAALAVPLVAALVLLSTTSFLFPEPVYDPKNEPQKPKPIPLSAASDRVLFEVDTKDDITGPWRAGVLDVYDSDAWKLAPFDRTRWRALDATGSLDPLRSDAPRLAVSITVRDLGDSAVLPILAGTNVVTGDLGGFVFDPRPALVRVKEGRIPKDLSYTIDAPAYPTEDQLKAVTTTASGVEVAEQLAAPPMPSLVRDLLAQAGPTPWERLDLLRQTLLENVTATGAGTPDDITPDRVVEILGPESKANPFEIVATEALLARWAGIPSRIGFGFDGLNDEDGVFTVRPANSAQWLEVLWPGYGWVTLIGSPKQAEASLDDALTRFNPDVVTGTDVAVEIFLPFEQADLRQTYERIRDEIIFWLPIVALLVLAWVAWPIAAKAHRRAKRRRWAAGVGPAAQIAVEYTELRDLATDLNIGDIYTTPLEFLYTVRDDEEHTQLAWLHARSLYGDLRAASEADVRSAEAMSMSVRRRLARAQPVLAQIGSLVSRASLELPYSDEIPNVRTPRLPALPRPWRLVARLRPKAPRRRARATVGRPAGRLSGAAATVRRLIPARSS